MGGGGNCNYTIGHIKKKLPFEKKLKITMFTSKSLFQLSLFISNLTALLLLWSRRKKFNFKQDEKYK
jgi:hypothetical protein